MASALVAILAIFPAQASIENPSILPTPPMGFNNWARFECGLNQSLFVETADAMVSKGLLAAGYDRIHLDDCWLQHERAPNGSLQWNTTLFPNGLIWLGECFKGKGFHFGIYEDSGNATCGGYPGSRGHEELDAKTFESWGVEYLKLDGCNVYPDNEQEYQTLYSKWHQVLTSLEHPLIFSESAPAYFSATDNNTDWYEVMDWVPLYGELARHSTDIAVYGLYPASHYWQSVMVNYGFEVLLARYQQPGYYNDPDFIIPDWPWLTLDEKKSHFALWSSFSAPLIISAYIPDLSDAEVEYLTNKDIIAVDQDALAMQATLVSQDGYFDVLTKSLANGDRLLTVLNRGNYTNSTTVSIERVGLETYHTYTVKDLWTGDSNKFSGSIHITLNTHATAIYRISEVSSVIPTGMIFNTASLSCMTASDTSITFTNCTALDAQVWQVSSSGTLSPLSAPNKCLESSAHGVSLGRCNSRSASMRWVYHVTGNLINSATRLCLQERAGYLGKCGEELDNQVFGLPSGVRVVRGGKV
ncbi:putative alpha-galactosidase [Rhizodiscina lignyota]|uniref:Alpha-galactosidase n=1 Tax=Rhizodiscina lignyota TaxID=1504668 RepID=A0A9P4IKL6_9PEZI|nr:putative alpha-galactosidase [Rhizodiscina lignyota]